VYEWKENILLMESYVWNNSALILNQRFILRYSSMLLTWHQYSLQEVKKNQQCCDFTIGGWHEQGTGGWRLLANTS
jgi:hypothetical protein